jgi:SEC-C motif-containing protein
MSFAPPDPSAACPCGRLSARRVPQAFGDCCGRYIDHFDTAAAPDAEHLMRSRYSAFVLQRRNYLQATWHASTRPATLDFEPDARWLGLEVRGHRVLDAEHAEVEFVARYRVAGRAVRLHERSRFVREDGRWYYLEGDQF